MEYTLKVTESQLDLLSAGLSLLEQNIIASTGSMDALNETYGKDPERLELIESSKSILSDIEALNNNINNINYQETIDSFITRKKAFKKKNK